MGYCPRCGENSPIAVNPERQAGRGGKPVLRVPARSRVVSLDQSAASGEIFAFAGVRFKARREGDYIYLDLQE